jgi:acyl-CoA synthetase (NDP forming)
VIGASRRRGTIGAEIFHNLLANGFNGTVFPVNPGASSVQGVLAYPSLTAVPGDVDLAVIVVPARHVEPIIDDCVAKGVGAVLLISAGFAETGDEGRRLQSAITTKLRAAGIRMVGPNCLGLLNADPEIALDATFAPTWPPHGSVAFSSQSGAVGLAILDYAAELGIGVHQFVSVGNKTDVSGNDLIEHWATDPAVRVILLYLESFGNPQNFLRIATEVSRTKPIVAVKSGRHSGPTPALAASAAPIDDASVRALFEQAGVIRVETLTQLFDTALLLAYQPLPAGPRVAVVGNSSALGVLVADAVLDGGMELAGPPVDVGTAAPPEEFAAAVARAVRDDPPDGADALIAVFVPPVAIPGAEYARALREAVAGSDKPVVAVFLAVEGVPAELSVAREDGSPGPGSVPSYPSPERAAAALARVSRYARWRAQPVGEFVSPPGIDAERARALVARLGAERTHSLGDDDAVELLACYGVAVTDFRLVSHADAAVAAAEELGYPVAMKAVGDRWRHRTDLVGVRLDLDAASGVRRAHADLARLTGQNEVYVQRMAPKGSSWVLEIVDDPSFGSLLSFGMSGMATELLGDRAFRVVPVSDQDAAALVRAPRAAPILAGYRGTEPVDLAALEELVLRVGRIAEDLPEVRSLALDPVLCSPEGAFVTGARIVLGPPPTRHDSGPRRLS